MTNNLECPICLDNLSDEPVAVLGLCCHQHHVSCLEEWFRTKQQLVCPICNQESLGYYRTTVFAEDVQSDDQIFTDTTRIDQIQTDSPNQPYRVSESNQEDLIHSDSDLEGNSNYNIETSSESDTNQMDTQNIDVSKSDESDNSDTGLNSPHNSPQPYRITTRSRAYRCHDTRHLFDNLLSGNNDRFNHNKIAEILSEVNHGNHTYNRPRRPVHGDFYVAGHQPRDVTGFPRVFQVSSPSYNRDSLSTISLGSERGSVSIPPLPPSNVSVNEKTRRCSCTIQ